VVGTFFLVLESRLSNALPLHHPAPPHSPIPAASRPLHHRAAPSPSHPLLLAAAASDQPDWPSDSSDDNYADEVEQAPDIVHATASKTTLMELQQDLLLLLVGQNKGFSVLESDREDIEDTLRDLEAVNPNPRPTESFSQGTSPLSGTWRLIYTGTKKGGREGGRGKRGASESGVVP